MPNTYYLLMLFEDGKELTDQLSAANLDEAEKLFTEKHKPDKSRALEFWAVNMFEEFDTDPEEPSPTTEREPQAGETEPSHRWQCNCGSRKFYLDMGDVSDPIPKYRCKECEFPCHA